MRRMAAVSSDGAVMPNVAQIIGSLRPSKYVVKGKKGRGPISVSRARNSIGSYMPDTPVVDKITAAISTTFLIESARSVLPISLQMLKHFLSSSLDEGHTKNLLLGLILRHFPS